MFPSTHNLVSHMIPPLYSHPYPLTTATPHTDLRPSTLRSAWHFSDRVRSDQPALRQPTRQPPQPACGHRCRHAHRPPPVCSPPSVCSPPPHPHDGQQLRLCARGGESQAGAPRPRPRSACGSKRATAGGRADALPPAWEEAPIRGGGHGSASGGRGGGEAREDVVGRAPTIADIDGGRCYRC